MRGAFVWHDLVATDPARAAEFYTALFGWSTPEWDMGALGTYTGLTIGEIPIARIVPHDASVEIPAMWASYLETAVEVDAACATAEAAGGSVVVAAIDIPGIARIAAARDPDGALFFPARTAADAQGMPTTPRGTPGSIVWHELMSRDPEASVQFYRPIAGWTDAPMPGPHGSPYHTLSAGGVPQAGIMTFPPGLDIPPSWDVYIECVHSTIQEAVAEAARLGGNAVTDVMTVPGFGEFAVIEDTTGAWFYLIKSAG